jgi:hypothetical protein
MKKKLGLFIFCALFASFTKVLAQKDTLHLYYMGSQTTVADSNDAKLTKWAKSLKGKHSDVEIYTYYDNSDFKQGMAERCENLSLVVNRKARDLITIKKSAAVKGKKHQRYVADVVYTKEFVSSLEQGNTEATPTTRVTATETKTTSNNSGNNNSGNSTTNTNNSALNNNNNNNGGNNTTTTKTEPKSTETPTYAPSPVRKKGDVWYDTVYVNKELKIIKHVVK